MKVCFDCGETKPLDQFRHGGRCRSCQARSARDWYYAHRDYALVRMRAYAKKRAKPQRNRGRPKASEDVHAGRPLRKLIDGKLRCGHCHIFKPIDQYHFNRRDHNQCTCWCKDCTKTFRPLNTKDKGS